MMRRHVFTGSSNESFSIFSHFFLSQDEHQRLPRRDNDPYTYETMLKILSKNVNLMSPSHFFGEFVVDPSPHSLALSFFALFSSIASFLSSSIATVAVIIINDWLRKASK
jgi:hypothetical protein